MLKNENTPIHPLFILMNDEYGLAISILLLMVGDFFIFEIKYRCFSQCVFTHKRCFSRLIFNKYGYFIQKVSKNFGIVKKTPTFAPNDSGSIIHKV